MSSILHVNHRYWPVVGGSEQSVRAVASRQVKDGHSVTVLTTDADDFSAFWDPGVKRLPARKELNQGVRIVRTPIGYLPGGLWSFAALRRVQTYLGQAKPLAAALGRLVPYLPELDKDISELGDNWDFVIDWNITFDNLAAAARELAAKSACPFISVPFLHLGEGAKSSVRRYYTMPHQLQILESADRVIVQTEVARSYLLQAGVEAQRVFTVGLGINPHALAGGNAERFRTRFGTDSPIVTAIGPLTRDKGTQDLVEAAAIVMSQDISMSLVLAGPPMNDFESFWKGVPADVKRRIIRLGPVVGEEKNDLLAATDVLALPSRTDSFGIVLLEAWAYGKPVIGAQAGGIPGLIDDGETATFVPYGDAESLARAIVEIVGNPNVAKTWGERGRLKVMNTYTWEHVYERFSRASGIS